MSRYYAVGDGVPDIRELMKREVFAERNPRCDDHFDKSRPCAADEYGVSDLYAVLDSWLMSGAPSWRDGKYPFTFMVQGASGNGNIGLVDTANTVTQIQVLEGFMPLPELVDVDAGAEAGAFILVPDPGAADPRGFNPLVANTQLPYGGRITMQLEELSRQSFTDRRGRRHHIEFNTELVRDPGGPNAMMRITPVVPEDGIFTFTHPITDITRLTVQFLNPDEPLRLPADTVRGMRFEVSPGGANLPPLGTLIVTGPQQTGDGSPLDFGSLLMPGDRIYFEGVEFDRTAAPIAASGMPIGQLELYLNRPDGLFAGDFMKYSNLNSNQFTLDPMVSGIAVAPGPLALRSVPVLRIAKNRVRVSLRIRRVIKGITNYIAP